MTDTTGVVALTPVTPAHCKLVATVAIDVVFFRAVTIPDAAVVSLPKSCTVTGIETSNRRRPAPALLPIATCVGATESVVASVAANCDDARSDSAPALASESVVLTGRSVMFTVTDDDAAP